MKSLGVRTLRWTTEKISAWSSQEACAGRWISCAFGQAVTIRSAEAAPRWEDPLSTIQNTRSALAYGSLVITCSASRANGAIPVVSSHRPVTRPQWTSQAAR